MDFYFDNPSDSLKYEREIIWIISYEQKFLM